MASETPAYPLRFDIDYPERLSRWKIFLKWLFFIPAGIIYYLLAFAILFIPVLAWITILFRKKYPRWWFDFMVNYLRFSYRLGAYIYLLRDEYPSLDEEQAVHLQVDYPEHLNRWLPTVKWILAIPHFLILYALQTLALVFLLIAWFAILFTGQFPRGLFNFVVGFNRWQLRVNAYAIYLFTDKYPPFSLN